MANSTPLPQELTDSIIDFLFDDKDTLSCCNLVCKSWNARSTQHLWQQIVLNRRVNTRSMLHDLPPGFAYIQHLMIVDIPAFDTNQFLLCLPRLTRLATFCLRAVSGPLSISGDQVLSPTLRSLELRQIRFHAASDMHNLFIVFPSLKELSFGNALWIANDSGKLRDPFLAPNPDTRPLVSLNTLKLNLGAYDVVMFFRLIARYSIRADHIYIVTLPVESTVGLAELLDTLVPSASCFTWDTRGTVCESVLAGHFSF